MTSKESEINLIEIARSFSFRRNLGDYQGVEFFCSEKKECPESEAEKTSEQLYDFCRKQVTRDMVKFMTEIRNPIALAEKNIVANPNPSVEEWEAMNPEEKWLRLELNRAVKRTAYKLKDK